MKEAFLEGLQQDWNRIKRQSYQALFAEATMGIAAIAVARTGLDPKIVQNLPALSQQLQTSTQTVVRALGSNPRLSSGLMQVTRLPQTAEQAVERGPQLLRALENALPALENNLTAEVRDAYNLLVTLGTCWSNGHK